jgi:hypothetical protein
MPAIADPYRGRPVHTPADERRHTESGASQPPTVSLRIRTAVQRSALTSALADGADPSDRRELALRAIQLTSRRSRKTMARTLRRIVAEAHQPPLARSSAAPIRRVAVLDAEGAINAIIERLTDDQPVHPHGMAIVLRTITNADTSALYLPSEPGTLRRVISVATAAMDPGATESHEFPLTA